MAKKPIPIFQVDAFAASLFQGNPAAVCVLDHWLRDDLLQAIAAENALSETAYIVPLSDGVHDYHLRWFTPVAEVDLCGHATLASAYCVFTHLGFQKDSIAFKTLSGTLGVTRSTQGYTLDFPARSYTEMADKTALETLVGQKILTGLQSIKTCAVLPSPQDVQNFKPNLPAIKAMASDGLVITARAGTGHYADVDFVSRYFAPHVGIDEDPVTGSAHCLLAPYWAKILNKTTLKARQISAREGVLALELHGTRVKITGEAKLYLKGEIYV